MWEKFDNINGWKEAALKDREKMKRHLISSKKDNQELKNEVDGLTSELKFIQDKLREV